MLFQVNSVQNILNHCVLVFFPILRSLKSMIFVFFSTLPSIYFLSGNFKKKMDLRPSMVLEQSSEVSVPLIFHQTSPSAIMKHKLCLLNCVISNIWVWSSLQSPFRSASVSTMNKNLLHSAAPQFLWYAPLCFVHFSWDFPLYCWDSVFLLISIC